jgi:hypothetical protein
VRTVSVWDHEPTADEILQKRVQAGWMPTPSQTVDGEVVEGYAACMFKPVVPRT